MEKEWGKSCFEITCIKCGGKEVSLRRSNDSEGDLPWVLSLECDKCGHFTRLARMKNGYDILPRERSLSD